VKAANAPRRAAVTLGRKPKLTEHQKREAIRRRDKLGEPLREIARSASGAGRTLRCAGGSAPARRPTK
jgi:hypothetical protein